MTSNEPVDAVITWVDGYDNAHQQKLNNYLLKQGIHRPLAASPTRFNQHGEIDYCVRSLLYFAPWISTIYIVTDAQVPAIISQLSETVYKNKVKLIDHRDIFSGFEHCLPTFNSLTIESVLWRIKGIANKFIYLNDDCALIRPVVYEDFFRKNQVVIRGNWKVFGERKWQNRVKKYLGKHAAPNEHRDMQEASARMALYTRNFFHLPHVPFAVNKTTIENFFMNSPELLSNNLRFAFRDSQQFWPISLATHLEIKNKTAIIDNSLEGVMVNGACHSHEKISKKFQRADKNHKVAFICMQSIDTAPELTQKMMLNWLASKIPSIDYD